MPNDSRLVDASGRPLTSQPHNYAIGPFVIQAAQTPPELMQLGFAAGDARAMAYATWACTSVVITQIGDFIGRAEIRLSALEKVLNKDPNFKAAYELAAQEVQAELMKKHQEEMAKAQQAQPPGPGDTVN